MRISTKSIYENATTQLNTLQSNMARTQNQLATNKRMLTAADDPIASARALEVTQSKSLNTQYATNRSNANSSLSLVEGALSDSGDLLMDVQTLVVQAGNGTLSKADRDMIATEIEGRMHDLLGVANTTDGTGGYLFSGYRGTTIPFIQTDTGAITRATRASASCRSAPRARSRSAIRAARSSRTTAPATAATRPSWSTATRARAIATTGSVSDATKLTGHNYTLEFKVAGTPAVTTYSVTDTSTSPASAVLSDEPYVSGKQITFDGTSFAINGQPADGDKFEVKPSEKESIFTTMTSLVKALRDSGRRHRRPRHAVEQAQHRQRKPEILARQHPDGARLGRLAHEGTRLPRQLRLRPRHPVRRHAVEAAGPRHREGDLAVRDPADDAGSGRAESCGSLRSPG
jgi:flagellar hook-associated protein 3 FlgL